MSVNIHVWTCVEIRGQLHGALPQEHSSLCFKDRFSHWPHTLSRFTTKYSIAIHLCLTSNGIASR